jgi:hypothetical protein
MQDHFLLAMALGVLAARRNRRVSSRKRAQNWRSNGVAGSENQVAPAAAADPAAGSGGDDDQVEIMRKTLAEPQGELLRKHILFILDKARSEDEGSSNPGSYDEQLMELAVAFVSTSTPELSPFLITITDEVEKAFDTDLGLLFGEREDMLGQRGGDRDVMPAVAEGFPMTSGDTASAGRRLNMLCTVLCFLFQHAEEAAASIAPGIVPTHLAAMFGVTLQGLATSSNNDSMNDSDRLDDHVETASSISSSTMLCMVLDAYLSAFCCSDDAAAAAAQSSSYMGPAALAQAENVVLETLAQLHDIMGESLKELSRQLACKVEKSIEWGK